MGDRRLLELHGKRILLAGATSSVGEPVAKALAGDNEVIAVARFSNPKALRRLEAAGVECMTFDLAAGTGGFAALPDGVDYVMNFAVAQTADWDAAITANAEGVGLLMQRYAAAAAYLHCSSTAVYQHAGPSPGRSLTPSATTTAGSWRRTPSPRSPPKRLPGPWRGRSGCPRPLRVSMFPNGDRVGFPYVHFEMMRAGATIELHPERPNVYNPIHLDDIVAMVPALLEVASVPATIVNWAGPDTVSIEQWCAYMTELTGIEVTFAENPDMIGSVVPDVTRLHALVGPAKVEWRDGIRRMIAARHSDLLRPTAL
jgi:nucleoside-diphosphate-sugar epimerase